MNKITLLITSIILYLSPIEVNANSCKIEGYTIGFFNGVATTLDDAKSGILKLKSTINIDNYNGEDVEYQLFYNDSYIDEGMLNVLGDFAETFDQRTQEIQNGKFNRWEAFWDIISGKQSSTIIQKIESLIPGFLSFIHDEFSLYINFTISTFLEALATLSGSTPNTEEVRMKHNLINDTQTWKGKKLIYIAHSQGNLWMNESFNHVLSQPGYDTSNIKVIHIAPASYITNGDYILSNNDHVINLLRVTGLVSVPLSNFVAHISDKDMSGHKLIDTYLTNYKSIEMIKASVESSLYNLQKPDMEDFLFKIEYKNSPNFTSQHESTQYSFVDSKEDLHLEYDHPYNYLQYHTDFTQRYLNQKQGSKSLSFTYDAYNITIDSCYGYHERKPPKETIPNDVSFLFADYTNIKKIISPMEMTSTKRVIDRYGIVWFDYEYDASPQYDGGYASCFGFGSFIDLITDQNIYSQSENKYLSQHELSGTFILSSLLEANYCEGH